MHVIALYPFVIAPRWTLMMLVQHLDSSSLNNMFRVFAKYCHGNVVGLALYMKFKL